MTRALSLTVCGNLLSGSLCSIDPLTLPFPKKLYAQLDSPADRAASLWDGFDELPLEVYLVAAAAL
jgi:hypothetical protein